MKKIFSALLSIIIFSSAVTPVTYAAGDSDTGLPEIHITLKNNASPADMNKDDYLDADFSLTGADEFDLSTDDFFIKGRGNATWNLEKKPFALKFGSKTDLLGMGSAKKWVLLANYYDKTLLRNALTLYLGQQLGIDYTPEFRFVDVYLNGSYQGNYLLTEKVEKGKQRINIDSDEGILFEIEMQYRHDDCSYCHQTAEGVHIMYKEPEAGDISADDMTMLMTENNRFLDDMELSLKQGIDEYSKYIDVDSFINWYILNEFAKNYDSAFVTSCYCYRDKDGLLFMGPPWDYDTCYGNQDVATGLNPEGYHVIGAPWIRLLCADRNFRALLSERWSELYENGFFEEIPDWIDTQAKYIEKSQKLEQQRWPNAMALRDLRGSGTVYTTFSQEVAYMKDFIGKRTEWLDSQWNMSTAFAFAPLTSENIFTYDIKSVTAPNGQPNETALNLFDTDKATKYCTNAKLPLTVEWEMTNPCKITSYVIVTANDIPARDPSAWRLEGLDENGWQIISEESGQRLPDERFAGTEYLVKTPGEYLRYRMVFTAQKDTGDGYFQLGEVLLGGSDTEKIIKTNDAIAQITKPLSLSCRAPFTEATKMLADLSETETKYISNASVIDEARAYLESAIGDTDSDGGLSAADALLILQHSVKKITLTGTALSAADADGNSIADAADALLVLQRSVGKITSFLG